MDMGLLKLPRLTTPERVGFEKFRDRQRARRDAPQAKPESVLLGLHPVEGDPVDLRVFTSEYTAPTEEEQASANAVMEDLLREGDLPEGFGEGLDTYFDI